MQREDWVVLSGSALSGGQVGTSVCIPDVCYPEVGERGGGLIIKVGLGYCWNLLRALRWTGSKDIC